MDEATALQTRLKQFAASLSRAEIARKTGTSVMNVSRYLKGTRVPAEFCMALVREFGVNANWLLAGQGGPFVSDLATQHGHMAGNLLELVEAMSAVAKMRLGSLAGQDHMKLLRQLNESLGTYERLREKMNSHSRGILDEVLRELQGALTTMDMTRAGALRKAAEQVARLCEDTELSRKLLGMQAHHSYLAGRTEEALQLMRKRFVQSIGEGRIESEDQARDALRLVVTLSDTGRVREALRMARAFLEIADDNADRLPSIPTLGTFCAQLLCARGEVDAALAQLQRWMPAQQGRPRAVSQAVLVRAQLLAGLMTFDEAIAAPGLPQPKFAHILGIACAMEDAPAMRACMKFMDSDAGREVKERMLSPHYAPLLARAIERSDRRTIREFESLVQTRAGRPATQLELMIVQAQLHCILGDRKRAATLHAKAELEFKKVAEPESVEIGLRATHLRTGIQMGDAQARQALTAVTSGGCRLFQALSAQSPL